MRRNHTMRSGIVAAADSAIYVGLYLFYVCLYRVLGRDPHWGTQVHSRTHWYTHILEVHVLGDTHTLDIYTPKDTHTHI